MKPRIICHMISSIDGRLQIERYSKLYKNEDDNLALDLYLNLGLQMESDAWIIGSGTALSMGIDEYENSLNDSFSQTLSTYISKKSSTRYCIIFDSKGTLKYSDNMLMNDNIIAILGENVSKDYLSFLRRIGVSYLFAGKNGKNFKLALSTLYSDFGIKTALLEGGGGLNGNFLQANLIDELSIVLYPGVDGLSGISSIFEYKGNETDTPSINQCYTLKSMQKLEADLIWLRYDVHIEN